MQAGLINDYRRRSLPTEEAHEEAAAGCSGFFRVLRIEYAKFFSMAFLYFCIVFAYSILRDTKDVVVIGRMLPASIQYLKSFVVMGATMGFAVFFQFLLASGISLERIMFSLNIGFGIFFVIFALILLPNMSYIEPYRYWINDIFADKKMFVNGLEFLKGLLLTVNFWTGTLLYTTAELWGNVMTSVMFFSIANEICPLRQALRFYPLFIIAANIGLICSGGFMITTSHVLRSYPGHTFFIIGILLLFVAALCLINVFTYRHLVKNIIPYPIYIVFENTQKRGSKKEKIGIIDGFKIMLKTPIVFHLSITVLGYGICTNLTEGAYKSTMQQKSSASNSANTMTDVMSIQGKQQCYIGAAVICVLLSPIKQFIQKRGWLSLGMLTPLLTLCSAVIFLSFVWGNVSMDVIGKAADNIVIRIGKPFFTSMGWKSNKEYELNIGFYVVNLIKILKYAAFDICKEAIGVKIPKQYKARFKGVYDGVFGKLGKSFSSYLQIALFFILNTTDIRLASPIMALAVITVASGWTFSTLYLGRKYDEAVREDRDLYINEVTSKGSKGEKPGKEVAQ